MIVKSTNTLNRIHSSTICPSCSGLKLSLTVRRNEIISIIVQAGMQNVFQIEIWQLICFQRNGIIIFNIVFSAPELEAKVSYSDHFLSSVCPSVFLLFTFFTSVPEPPDQFQPNYA